MISNIWWLYPTITTWANYSPIIIKITVRGEGHSFLLQGLLGGLEKSSFNMNINKGEFRVATKGDVVPDFQFFQKLFKLLLASANLPDTCQFPWANVFQIRLFHKIVFVQLTDYILRMFCFFNYFLCYCICFEKFCVLQKIKSCSSVFCPNLHWIWTKDSTSMLYLHLILVKNTERTNFSDNKENG